MGTPIDRVPRGIAEYEVKFARLSEADQKIVSLAEDSILADTSRTHARRTQPDGTTIDLTAYDEFDVGLTFHDRDGRPEFIDFVIFEPT